MGKVLKIQTKTADSHEDVFIERYDRIFSWSLQLADRDRELAEDLVHDLFIQFTLSEPDLTSLSNVDGYLYTMLRNLHLAHRRRLTRNRLNQFSVADYDSAETGLRTIDARDQIEAQDELRRICEYACSRKETAKLASVLILRFFHGYYPAEISRILLSTRQAVDKWLRLARVEAKAALADSSRLAFAVPRHSRRISEKGSNEFALPPRQFLLELRELVFQSQRGQCPGFDQLRALYGMSGVESERAPDPLRSESIGLTEAVARESSSNKIDRTNSSAGCEAFADRPGTQAGADPIQDRLGAAGEPVPCDLLAHIVSCSDCLNSVSKLLGLPGLSERFAEDTLGRDGGKRGKGGDGGASGGGKTGNMLSRLRKRAKQTFEHKPQELCVAVNGYALASQSVNSELSELHLVYDSPENIGFIEVYSEQKVRMLIVALDEPPPAGPGEQDFQFHYSDGRLLDLKVRFASPWPTINVVYRDPSFRDAIPAKEDRLVESGAAVGTAMEVGPNSRGSVALEVTPSVAPLTIAREVGRDSSRPDRQSRSLLRQRLSSARQFFSWGFWLRPGVVTAVFALLIIAGALWLLRRGTHLSSISGSELLQKSKLAEEALASQPGIVFHRTLNYEERRGSGSETVIRRRIDIWQSREKGLTVRRVYDDSGRLLAGEWSRLDGPSTVYRRQVQGASTESFEDEQPLLRGRDAWQIAPSAADFTSIAGQDVKLRVEESAAAYVISFQGDSAAVLASRHSQNINKLAVTSAVLTIGKQDLHPTGLVIQAKSVIPAGEFIEYRYTENSLERRSPASVPPAEFEPDPEFLVPARVSRARNSIAEPATSTPSMPAVATAELEAQVISLLGRAGADTDDQTIVNRTADGKLEIRGTVATDERRNEILQALGPVRNQPAVRIAIETVSEAVARQAQGGQKPTQQTVSMQEVEVSRAEMPAYDDLRAYLGGDDQRISKFASTILNGSREAMSQAGTARRLAGRFSQDELAGMSESARAEVLSVIQEHIRLCERSIRQIDLELQPVFFRGVQAAAKPVQFESEADVSRATERLFAMIAANDRILRRALSASGGKGGAAASVAEIKSAAFWESVRNVENLAEGIARYKSN